MELAVINNGQITMSLDYLSNLMVQTALLATEKATEITLKIIEENNQKNTLVDTAKAAEILNCTPRTIIKYITKGHKHAGKLTAIHNGKSYKISLFEINKFKNRYE